MAGKQLRAASVVVIGLGASGEAAALLARKKGARVTANDSRPRDVLEAVAARLEAKDIELEFGSHDLAGLNAADLIVVSPGVPNLPFLRDAERRGARIVGELEFGSWYVDADIIAIGGSNGKSTTTELAGVLGQTSGRPTFVGGNLGTPLCQALLHDDPALQQGGICVLEASSFQLERVAGFRPRASVLLNVTPDHLDRYASFEAYAQAKANAFAAQTNEDVAIVPYGDALCGRLAKLGYGHLVEIDGPAPATLGVEVTSSGDMLVDRLAAVTFPLRNFALEGRHNVTNLAAAWAAVTAVGADPNLFGAAISQFRGLAHRMVLVRMLDDVAFYDDSKGTNVGASVTAVRGVRQEHVVLIAGGRDKGGSYEPLIDALGQKARALVTLGESAGLLQKAAKGHNFPVLAASSMEQAVAMAFDVARRGDAVLLSPACSSFDMFRDYKHRGEVFEQAVKSLTGRGGQ